MVKGRKVELAGKEYVVPSLTVDQVDAFIADGTMDKVPQNGLTYIALPESRKALRVVAAAALARNHPEITVDTVGELIDLASVEALVDAVMGASGLVARASKGEAESP